MYHTLFLHQQFTPSHTRSVFTTNKTKKARLRGRSHYGEAKARHGRLGGASVLLVSVAIAFLLSAYFFLTYSIVGDTFRASEYRKHLGELKEESRLLKFDIARLNSYNYILEQSRTLEMVEARNPKYIEIGADILARIDN